MKVLSLNIARNIHNFTLDGIEPDQLGGFVELASPLGTVRVKLRAEQIAAALEAVAVAVSGLATSMLTSVTADAVAPVLAIEHQPEAEAPAAMVFQVGNHYATRVGHIVLLTHSTPGVVYGSYAGGRRDEWCDDGAYQEGKEFPNDLVRLATPDEVALYISASNIETASGDDDLPF